MGDFVYQPGGATGSNPSSTQGSFFSSSQTKQASVFFPGSGVASNSPLAQYLGGQIPAAAAAKNQWLTTTQAKRQFATLTGAQMNELAATVKGMPKGYFSNAKALWNAAVDGSWAANQNGQKLSPWDIVSGLQSGQFHPGQLSTGSAGPGGSGSSGHSSSSSRSVTHQITDKGAADRLLDDVLSNYLGRSANDAEKANFLKSLNAKEKATPTSVSTSQSSSSYSGTSSTSSSSSQSTSHTGIDPQTEAINKAKGDSGYAEYQYGTTYMNAFLSALGAPVSAAGTV